MTEPEPLPDDWPFAAYCKSRCKPGKKGCKARLTAVRWDLLKLKCKKLKGKGKL